MLQLGKVSEGVGECALEAKTTDLDPGDPVVVGAGDVVPLAGIRVGPTRRVEVFLESLHYGSVALGGDAEGDGEKPR